MSSTARGSIGLNLHRLWVAALLALMLAGCSAKLRTAPAVAAGCDLALDSGRLVADNESGLALADNAGETSPIRWPFGYSARRDLSGFVLMNQLGQAVAQEGDFITVGGGSRRDGVFDVCAASVTVVKAPG
jgi:hypothetical protein